MLTATSGEAPLPDGVEERLQQFAGLIAAAIANAESRAQLTASRARVVATADETRRRLQRDLHDGAQQRLVQTLIALNLAKRRARRERGPGARAARRGAAPCPAGDLRPARPRARHPPRRAQSRRAPRRRSIAGPRLPAARRAGRAGLAPPEVGRDSGLLRDRRDAGRASSEHAAASEAHVRVVAEDGALEIEVRDDGEEVPTPTPDPASSACATGSRPVRGPWRSASPTRRGHRRLGAAPDRRAGRSAQVMREADSIPAARDRPTRSQRRAPVGSCLDMTQPRVQPGPSSDAAALRAEEVGAHLQTILVVLIDLALTGQAAHWNVVGPNFRPATSSSTRWSRPGGRPPTALPSGRRRSDTRRTGGSRRSPRTPSCPRCPPACCPTASWLSR